ncbi:MAG: sigma-70 family RNA polymerase sigma factor [Planctomycetes bacterium]|nr:sigma-70 family RNA polymerase sigma factor [Planctomycetota bacterium]
MSGTDLRDGAFVAAYQTYVETLREYSHTLVRREWGSIHSVSDLLHEVFLRAQSRWERFQRSATCSVEVWLTGQLIDTVRDLNRRYLAAKRRAQAEVALSRLASYLAGNETDPLDAAARIEAREALAERLSLALARLKPAERNLLVRVYYHQDPPSQITADLQIANGAFRVRQSRALGKLRESWNELFGEEGST